MVATLRDHLSLHDRPVSFLFGAGSSCAVNVAPLKADGTPDGYVPLIPAVAGLTDLCRIEVSSLGGDFDHAWNGLVSECISLGQAPHIESLLSRVRAKLAALGPGDKLLGLDRAGWSKAEEAIRTTIATAACPADTSIPTTLPHHQFAHWLKLMNRKHPVEVFTTNYDVLFERALDDLRVPHFDGFIGSVSPFFSAEATENEDLLPGPIWVRVWKIHGSVNWSIVTDRAGARLTRGPPTTHGEMILPSDRKYDRSAKQPYRALIDRLRRVLSMPDALLVVNGFSFGDQHINAVIFDALDAYPRSHVLALVYNDISNSDHIVEVALRLPNLMVVGRNGCVLGARMLEWAPLGMDLKSSDPRLGGIIGSASNLAAGSIPWLLAGDFTAFANFLGTMSPIAKRLS